MTAPAIAAAAEGSLGEEGCAVFDPAIAAWWKAQHAAAFAAGTAPALPTTFDVTVSPREPLQAAIDRCRVGGSILLLPGTYEGGVVLSKEVHLFGRGEVTLQGVVVDEEGDGEEAVITSTAPAATLDGLVVRLGPHAEGYYGHLGILITAGSLLVRHCDVSSQSLSSICVQGASADSTILGCKVHGSSRSGIIFEEGSKGRVEGCDIVDNNWFGIDSADSEVVIIANNIHLTREYGVRISNCDQSTRLEDNHVWQNGKDGVFIFYNADPCLIANKINGNKGSGVSIYGGKGRLERNTIWTNVQGGVVVQERGDPTLIGNTIRDHSGEVGYGVLVLRSAFGNVVWGGGNRFSGNMAADLVCEEEEEEEEAAPVVGQLAQAPAADHLMVAPADADLLRELECIVCKDVMMRPFSVCPEGHASACMPCYKQLKACPVCRGKLLSPPARLRLLEDWAQDAGLMVPCPHTADGCPLHALRYADAGAHATSCDWSKVTLAKLGGACLFCLIILHACLVS